MFSNIAEQWLRRNDLPDLVRIAFGMVVRHPEVDRRSAYLRLPDYLPIRIDPDASDFNLQINVPAASTGIRGLRINRLTKWSIMGLARVSLRMDGTVVATTGGRVMAHALRLELDINTSPEFQGALPRDRFIDIYRELVALGRDIITDGLP